MSGGSSKGKSSSSTKADPSKGEYPGGPKGPTMTVQPTMPGQNEAIAAQLAAAFGQTPQGLLAHMNQFYRPMKLPDYAPPAATPTTPTTPATGSSGGKSYSHQDILRMMGIGQDFSL